MRGYHQRFKTALERFEEKVERIPECGCWIWIGNTNHDGYGFIHFEGKMQSAHRVSWKLFNSDIPKGINILHRCDTPSCVNPHHLFVGTQKDNAMDCSNKKRWPDRKGEKHNYAKLSAQDVAAIRNDSRTQREIASDYAVHQTLISRIKLGKNWNSI